MRLTWLLAVIAISGCGHPAGESKRKERDRIDLSQTVTRNPRAESGIFRNFPDNWRQFISSSPELKLPVIVHSREEVWQPQVSSQCRFSTDSGGVVPEVTLSWNEPDRQGAIRFDLALHHDGFGRNYYSTATASSLPKRFNLPPNSALINDPEAVLLTGPGLFPLLMNFKTQTVEDRARQQRVRNQTVGLRELAAGLTYTIRISRLAKHEWIEEKRSVFLTPVCPSSF
jgi:hypothetical protein